MGRIKDKFSSLFGSLISKDIRLEHGEVELVDETETEKQAHKARFGVVKALLVLLFFVITGWTIASFYLPRVQIGNTFVSARESNNELSSHIQKYADEYKLTLVYPDNSKKDYSLKELGVGVDFEKTVKSVRARQKSFSSRLYWWQPTITYLSIDSTGQLESFIDKKATVTVQPPTDATLSLKNGEVQIANSVEGKHYGLNEPVGTLLNAISKWQTEPVRLQTLSTRPAVTTKQLEPYEAKLKNILGQKVVFVINGREVQAASAEIANWVELSSEESGKAIDITVNSGKVLTYINNIAKASVRPPKAEIVVQRSDGTSSVLVKGVNGTDVINKETAASEVAASLLDGNAIRKVLDIKYASFKTVSAQAYDKWIEVDTTNKRMYAYEGTALVRTFLISAGAPATPTPSGQFAIRSKVVQQDMRGLNVDGTRYFQPNVSWVNYFYADYAIHGNYWRPLSYFGNVNSSHGCVGIVNSDAQWVYTWAPIGTPVIVHT